MNFLHIQLCTFHTIKALTYLFFGKCCVFLLFFDFFFKTIAKFKAIIFLASVIEGKEISVLYPLKFR